LLEAGHDVTHYNRGKSTQRLAANVRRITGDRKQFAQFERQVVQSGPYDCVIDMVCFEPQEAESLVRACRDAAGHVVFCSTVDVYNKPARSHPIAESHPVGGVSDYGKKKKVCEDILMQAHQRGDIQLTTIRPAHTYGEGGGVIHSLGWGSWFVDRVRNGKPVIVHGDGSSLWVSCHIDDVARAFVASMGNRSAMGRAYHTPGEVWMTWDQYHETVAAALGVPTPRLVHIPTELLWDAVPEHAGASRWNFMFNNIFDCGAARRDLGFKQTISFLDGVGRAIRWMDANGQIESWRAQPFYDRLVDAWDRCSVALVAQMKAPARVEAKAAKRRPSEAARRNAKPAAKRKARATNRVTAARVSGKRVAAHSRRARRR
jgi:nucleoside-diphosphate-sugar epimerase